MVQDRKQYLKNYYETNKDYLNKQTMENHKRINIDVECYCGRKVKYHSLPKHYKSNKHIKYLEDINNNLKDKLISI